MVALSLGKPMPRIGFGTASATLGQAEGRAALSAPGTATSTRPRRTTRWPRSATPSSRPCVTGLSPPADDLYITSKLAVTDAHPGRVLPALHKSLRLVLALQHNSSSSL